MGSRKQFAGALTILLAVVIMTCEAINTMTLCSHPITYIMPCSLQARHTVAFASAQFPQYNWRYKFIGTSEISIRSFIAAWSVNGTECDALLGPGFSSLAAGMSPTVDKPWLDWSATSTELSDKVNYPTFSRVAPTDAIAATLLVQAISTFNWKLINIICVDGPYGRSVTTGLSDALSAVGGSVESSRCISSTSGNDTLVPILTSLRTAQSRIVAIAMSPTDPAYTSLVETLIDKGWENEFILLFSEGFCSSNVPSFYHFAGAFCLTYAVDTTLRDPFLSSYTQRNTTRDQQDLKDLGFDTSQLDLVSDDIYGSFAHDATILMMTALTTFSSSGADTIYQHLRKTVVTGFTGDVRLDSNGDRQSSNAVLYNVVNGAKVSVASIQNKSMILTTIGQTQGAFVLGGFSSMTNMPSPFRPVPPPSGSISVTTMIAGVVAAGALFPFIYVLYRLRKHKNFKKLLTSGAALNIFEVVLLLGMIILKIFSVFQVAGSGNANIAFIAVYILITAIAVLIGLVLIFRLLMYFRASIQNLDDTDLEIVLHHEFLIDQVKTVGLALQDIPIIVMAFTAVLQNASTVVVLLSLCLSCISAGTKLVTAKETLAKIFFDPPPYKRRFYHFRDVARYVLLAIRLSGPRGVSFEESLKTLEVSGTSTLEQIQEYQRQTALRFPERFRFVKHAARRSAVALAHVDVTRDEFFGIVRPLLSAAYDPESCAEHAMGMSMASPASLGGGGRGLGGNPLASPAMFATSISSTGSAFGKKSQGESRPEPTTIQVSTISSAKQVPIVRRVTVVTDVDEL